MKANRKSRKAALHKVTEHLTDEFREKPETRIPEKTILELISYNEETVIMVENKPLDELLEHYNDKRKNWINVDGLSDRNLIDQIAKKFDLHYLLIEDITNVDHQPKTDQLEDHLFLTIIYFLLVKAIKHFHG